VRNLDRCSISSHSEFLRAVHERSAFQIEETFGLLHVPLLLSRTTGVSRTSQRFECHQRNCPVFVLFIMTDHIVRLTNSRFVHNHLGSETERTPRQFLSEERRAEIRYLTPIGCSGGQIRVHPGLTVPAQTLYNAGRLQLSQYRRNQAARLEEESKPIRILTHASCVMTIVSLDITFSTSHEPAAGSAGICWEWTIHRVRTDLVFRSS
jgi:hypothetical protein